MDAATSTSEQLQRWCQDFVKKIQALEDENKTLRLKLLEIEKKETVPKSSEHGVCVCEHVNPVGERRRRVVSESALSRQIPAAIQPLQIEIENTCGNSRMSGRFMFNSSEDVLMKDIHVKEELVDEIIPDNLQIDTPDVDENIDIDIKEEEVGYGHSKSNSDGDKFIHDSPVLDSLDVGESSPTPFKHEVDRSIQRMFRSPDQVSNIEPVQIQNGVDTELNPSSSYVPLQEFVNPQPHMSSKGLRGRKVSYLMTRPAERIHRCVTCSGTFDTQFKLREHKKYHTEEKESRVNPKTPHICSVCEKSFSRESALTNNMRDHSGEKPSRSLRIVKRTSVKRNLTAEKLNPGRPLKKQRKIEKEPEPNVGNGKELEVAHDSPTLNIEKDLTKEGRFDEFHTESLETQVQPLKRRFNSFLSFTMANRKEQKQMKGRGRYIVKFCGFCQKLMDSSTSFNDHVNQLHLYREFTQTGMDDETSGNSVLTTRLSRERPSNPPTGGGGELPTVLRDVRPPSGHRNVITARKTYSSTMIRPQYVRPESPDYYGINGELPAVLRDVRPPSGHRNVKTAKNTYSSIMIRPKYVRPESPVYYGINGELPTVLRDVRPPSGHLNVKPARKTYSSTMIRPQCVSPEPRDYYGINAGGGLLVAVKYIPRRPNSLVARKSTSRSHPVYPN